MARRRDGHETSGLIHYSDKGVQYVAVRYTQRLAEAGAVASVGSTGDSYDTQSMMVPVDAGSWSDPSYDWRTSWA